MEQTVNGVAFEARQELHPSSCHGCVGKDDNSLCNALYTGPAQDPSDACGRRKIIWVRKPVPQQPVTAKPATSANAIPTDAAARKEAPMHRGLFAYFPAALLEVARLSKTGSDQHNPGKPMFWDQTKSKDHADCLLRHQLEFDVVDTDGHYHAAKVAWRALAQLQELLTKDRA